MSFARSPPLVSLAHLVQNLFAVARRVELEQDAAAPIRQCVPVLRDDRVHEASAGEEGELSVGLVGRDLEQELEAVEAADELLAHLVRDGEGASERLVDRRLGRGRVLLREGEGRLEVLAPLRAAVGVGEGLGGEGGAVNDEEGSDAVLEQELAPVHHVAYVSRRPVGGA